MSNEHIERCPACNTIIIDAAGIGPCCPNLSCDVIDDFSNIDKDLMEVCKASQDGRLKKVLKDVQRQREIDKIAEKIKGHFYGEFTANDCATFLVDNGIRTAEGFKADIYGRDGGVIKPKKYGDE